MNMGGKISVICFLIVSLLTMLSQQQSNSKRVETKLGGVVGTMKQTDSGKRIYSFLGIPYIKPPLGNLRFKPPQPAEPWKKDISKKNDLTFCPQALLSNGTEDCVVLNVYTPWDPATPPLRNKYSVMVFIHGGGFIGGSSSSSVSGEPDYLVEQDVVLVTINYRLGILGFLSTSDKHFPGNYGLLDQVEALKWVRDNIEAFGGNPNQVTIFGESAGSASVHMLMLSPLAKGLFHRAIAQSGVGINLWATTRVARHHAQSVGTRMRCPGKTSTEMVECLQDKDSKSLVLYSDSEEKHGPPAEYWVPRIDFDAAKPLLPEHPISLMKSGQYNKVPLLLGYTKDEGALLFLEGSFEDHMKHQKMSEIWNFICQVALDFPEFLVSRKLGSKLCDEIKDHFFKNSFLFNGSKSFEDSKEDYIKFYGDYSFIAPIYKTAELMSKHSSVYMYQLDFLSDTKSWLSAIIPGATELKGYVSHADDLKYLFKYPQFNWKRGSSEYEMMKMMTKVWTDFAKSGELKVPNSNTEWPKVKPDSPVHVILDINPSVEDDKFHEEDLDFLDGLLDQFLYNPDFVEKETPWKYGEPSTGHLKSATAALIFIGLFVAFF